MKIQDYSKAFQAGQVLNRVFFGNKILKPHKIGELCLTSGKLVVCDPICFLLGTDPFAANFHPGYYPVIISVAYNQNNEEPMPAYAMVRLDEQTPVRWEMATKSGEDITELKEGEAFGYYVDSGISCFMDDDAAELLVNSTLEAENEDEDLVTELDNLLDENTSLGFMYANLCVNETTKANIIAFSTGIGDGFFVSYFGYDTNNNIVGVVTELWGGELV